MENHSYENVFRLQVLFDYRAAEIEPTYRFSFKPVRSNLFAYERFCTQSRLKQTHKVISEMANWLKSFNFQFR